MNRFLMRDERDLAVDHAADRLAYLVVSFGLLAIVIYRSFVNREAPWDLLALTILGGVVGTAYRAWRHATSRRWLLVGLVAGTIALLVGAVIALAART